MDQLSVLDINPPTAVDCSKYYAFIDECGHYGFDFESKGNSNFFLICAVIISEDKLAKLTEGINHIKQQQHFQTGEMKSNSLKPSRRKAIITDILELEFNYVILIVDKKNIYPHSGLYKSQKSFVKYLSNFLYKHLHVIYPHLNIMADQTGGTEFQHEFKAYIKSKNIQTNMFDDYDFNFTVSKDNVIVQLADIIVGSIALHYEDPLSINYEAILKSHCLHKILFPNEGDPHFQSKPEKEKFNAKIYYLSIRKINDFIKKSTNSNDFTTRMQCVFLWYLKTNVYEKPYQFISGQKIVQELSDGNNDKRINTDFVRREIIAPLRDKEIILSSCKKGYKIPTCLDDVKVYIRNTDEKVGPMLNRMRIARDQIFQITEGEIDVFDNEEFLKYKKYFE